MLDNEILKFQIEIALLTNHEITGLLSGIPVHETLM